MQGRTYQRQAGPNSQDSITSSPPRGGFPGGAMRHSAAIVVAALVACGGNEGLTAPTGSLQLTVTTTGEPGTETYSVSLDGGSPTNVGINGTVNLTAEAGTHAVLLGGFTDTCSLSGDNPQTVTVTADAMTAVSFAVSCAPPV